MTKPMMKRALQLRQDEGRDQRVQRHVVASDGRRRRRTASRNISSSPSRVCVEQEPLQRHLTRARAPARWRSCRRAAGRARRPSSRSSVGPMTNRVRKMLSPTMTCCGGIDGMPSALRVSAEHDHDAGERRAQHEQAGRDRQHRQQQDDDDRVGRVLRARSGSAMSMLASDSSSCRRRRRRAGRGVPRLRAGAGRRSVPFGVERTVGADLGHARDAIVRRRGAGATRSTSARATPTVRRTPTREHADQQRRPSPRRRRARAGASATTVSHDGSSHRGAHRANARAARRRRRRPGRAAPPTREGRTTIGCERRPGSRSPPVHVVEVQLGQHARRGSARTCRAGRPARRTAPRRPAWCGSTPTRPTILQAARGAAHFDVRPPAVRAERRRAAALGRAHRLAAAARDPIGEALPPPEDRVGAEHQRRGRRRATATIRRSEVPEADVAHRERSPAGAISVMRMPNSSSITTTSPAAMRRPLTSRSIGRAGGAVDLDDHARASARAGRARASWCGRARR